MDDAVMRGLQLQEEMDRRAAERAAPPPWDEEAPPIGREDIRPEQHIIGALWPAFVASLSSGRQVASTGLRGFDELLDGGLPLGQVSLLAGSPGLGKTMLALYMARHHARNGGAAVFWSLELPTKLLLARVVCQQTGAPWGKVLRNGCPDEVDQAGRDVADEQTFVLDTREGIRPLIDHVAGQGRPVLLVLDYLQLAASGARDLRQGVEEWSGKLVTLAKETGVAVLAVSSTSRAHYSIGADGKVELDRVLAMAKESGRLEFDAAVLMGLVHVREGDAEEGPGRYRKGWLVCAKNRLGLTGRVAVEVDGQAGTVRELDQADIAPAGQTMTDKEIELEVVRLCAEQELTTVRDLRDRIEARAARVDAAIKRLKARGSLIGGHGKKYQVK